MEFKLTEFDNTSNQIKGNIEDYNFIAKHFDEGSFYGINAGRVSKLEIWNGKYDFRNILVNYDRGWDIEPQTDEMKEVLKCLLEHLEISRRDLIMNQIYKAALKSHKWTKQGLNNPI